MGDFFRRRNWLVGGGVAILVIFVLPVYANAAGPTVADLFTGGYWGNPATGLLACEGKICTSLCQLLDLLNNLLFFGLTILIYIIAPIRFIIGGFFIMTGGTSEGLSKGKAMIKGTVIGLLIALGSFIIVATFLWLIGNNAADSGQPRVSWPEIECQPGINPNPTSTTPGDVYGPGGDDTGAHGHSFVLQQLFAANIEVTTTGGTQYVRANCDTDGDGQYEDSEKPCTSLQDLPTEGLFGLIQLKQTCEDYSVDTCRVIVTAGTEPGHQTHGPGRSIVDIENLPVIDEFIISQMLGIQSNVSFEYDKFYPGKDGGYYMYETNPSHWHICFKGPCGN